MATDLENAIEYYKDLLLYQYINKPNARKVIGLLVEQGLVDLLPVALRDAFDIDTAVGPQLDILGEYIGFGREISTEVPRDYFTFDDYENVITEADKFGFTDSTNTSTNANIAFYQYVFHSSAFNTLGDDEYRTLLKLKRFLNTSDNGLAGIIEYLDSAFPDNISLWDQLDMSASYFVTPSLSKIIKIAKDQNLLPKPMGVEITGLFEVADVLGTWGWFNSELSQLDGGFSDSHENEWTDRHFLNYIDRID